MNNRGTSIKDRSSSRRKFLFNVGVLTGLAFFAKTVSIRSSRKQKVIACTPASKSKMIKMLSQDGRLVEIDEALIMAVGKKINNKELQGWIKNKEQILLK